MNPVFLHDQCLSFIQNESLTLELKEGLSFEILAKESEFYWRMKISREGQI